LRGGPTGIKKETKVPNKMVGGGRMRHNLKNGVERTPLSLYLEEKYEKSEGGGDCWYEKASVTGNERPKLKSIP